MKKIARILSLFILLSVLAFPNFTVAETDNAINFLKLQTQDAWITQALVAAGEDGLELSHLDQVSGNLSTDYAKTILALSAAGENPYTYGNIDYVAKLKTYYNNNQIGDDSLLNDDAWSILALASVGEGNSDIVTYAKDFLLSNQNIDGGWGYAVGGDSDTNDTAAILLALIEAGVSSSDVSVAKAISYLQSVQNEDGGFGWQLGSSSDSGSDSWVIIALNKIGIDASDWTKGAENPISHLNSLQDIDGGFWWVEPGSSDFNNKAMTAYAVIALKDKSFPIGYHSESNSIPSGSHSIRIEGQNSTICDSYGEGDTVLEVIKDAAVSCGYSYNIEDTAYGSYLNKINNEEASGTSGWMYFVNYTSPLVGMSDYFLGDGDEILLYYGEWGWPPLRLVLSNDSVSSGESVTATVELFNNDSWNLLEGASIKGLDQDYITDSSGQATLSLPDGAYVLFAQKEDYIRSDKNNLFVGSGYSNNIGLSVEIEQSNNGSVLGDNISGQTIKFSITPNQISFGKMAPGDENSQDVTLLNESDFGLEITARVSGDSVFENNIKIEESDWSDFSNNINNGESKDVAVKLSVPNDYLDSGVKTGEIIFWAQRN